MLGFRESFAGLMTDSHGRHMRKLRVSLTDVCNYRCFYCMPENASFQPRSSYLDAVELRSIVSVLSDMGIEALRITGGEPTMRSDFSRIIRELTSVEGLRFGLTSNGQGLLEYLDLLKECRVLHLNISLDSLNSNKFRRITGHGELDRVFDTIETAREMGFTLKLNTVVARGVNFDELPELVQWASVRGIEIRFLELMKIGVAVPRRDELFVSAAEMREVLIPRFHLKKVPVEDDSTAQLMEGVHGERVGFIASETESFCGNCSRLRLSASGKLRACLMKDDGADLRAKDTFEIAEEIMRLLPMKPSNRINQSLESMHAIGG